MWKIDEDCPTGELKVDVSIDGDWRRIRHWIGFSFTSIFVNLNVNVREYYWRVVVKEHTASRWLSRLNRFFWLYLIRLMVPSARWRGWANNKSVQSAQSVSSFRRNLFILIIPLRDDWADWADYSDYIWWNWWCLRHSRDCDSIINLINLRHLFNRPEGACCIEEHKCLYVKDWRWLTYQLTKIDVKEKRVLIIYSTSTFSSPVGQSSWIETSMFVNIIGGVCSDQRPSLFTLRRNRFRGAP